MDRLGDALALMAAIVLFLYMFIAIGVGLAWPFLLFMKCG